MKRTILTLCVFFTLLTAANAGEMYRCVDRDGNTMISEYPRNGMKCVLKGSYRDPTPQERAKQEKEKSREADAYRKQWQAEAAKEELARAKRQKQEEMEKEEAAYKKRDEERAKKTAEELEKVEKRLHRGGSGKGEDTRW